jgi:tRNA(fMet)-specific endonuclease VapC
LDLENKKHQMEAKNYEAFFNTITTFNLTKENCEEISKIYWNLRKKGKENGKFDCIIAAIFLSNGINTIITKNKKHFENIDGFNVISY